MKKTLALTGAALAVVGMAFTATPANAAPKHLVKVSESAPKHLSAPKAAGLVSLVKTKYCASPQDGGYQVVVKVDHTKVSATKVDINKVYTEYQHRQLGLWGVEDWASSATDSIRNAGNTWGYVTRNPGAKNNWYPASPVFTVNGLNVNVSASGGGKTVNCTVPLP